MANLRTVRFPLALDLDRVVFGNRIEHVSTRAQSLDCDVAGWNRRGVPGIHLTEAATGRTFLVVPRRITAPASISAVLVVDPLPDVAESTLDLRSGTWIRGPVDAGPAHPEQLTDYAMAIRESWKGAFHFTSEIRKGTAILQEGLRAPQIGALHALLAHWTMTTEPATIVMPTGTGKTETMLGMLIAAQPSCLVVIVPTDALREQMAAKFRNLGLLARLGVIDESVQLPIVGVIKRRFADAAQALGFLSACNVVITTMAIAGQSSTEIQAAFATAASHLVIDEAHHISAQTWSSFRRHFANKPIAQFTATPFRSDRKHVEGRVIYSYPLRKAQAEGLFQGVRFLPIAEYDDELADKALARAAYGQLESDRAKNLDHLVLARAGTINRAKRVFQAYRDADVARVETGSVSFNPVLVHSDMTSAERRAAMSSVADRSSRAIVCVDMFGEGFDLPELKIAALHDVHKSLAITLQFVGRFTRSQSQLGEATVIANIANAAVERSLRALYSEDADWNVVLRTLSEGAVGRHATRVELIEKFAGCSGPIPIQNILPKMSTVVYATTCEEWAPHGVAPAVGEDRLYGEVAINTTDRIAVFVTRETTPVAWGDVRELADVTWDLYLLHWAASQNLLFIHSSNNGSYHEDIATAVAGANVDLVKGERMFRAFHNIRRLVLLNLGLKHVISRSVRFTMYTGSDVGDNLPEASQFNKTKANMFGHGYENGGRASVGCSYRGRVWSYRIAGDVGEWVEWCHAIGAKLSDSTITTDLALKHVIKPVIVSARPEATPIAVDWPDALRRMSEEVVLLSIGAECVPFYEADLGLAPPSAAGGIQFRVSAGVAAATIEVVFSDQRVAYRQVDGDPVELRFPRRSCSLTDFFQKEPPTILFADGSSLEYNVHFQLPEEYVPPFDRSRIEPWDWTGTDISVESQGLTRKAVSIQYRVIQEALGATPPPDVVFDDDNPGESADVVSIRTEGERLIVKLFHCKFSGAASPGARVGDLHVVCGQAQRSVYWRSAPERLIRHLELRESQRLRDGKPTRFMRGDLRVLRSLRDRAPEMSPEFEIVIVQPGVSVSGASADQLELLSVTELYLRETYNVPLRVVASA